LLQVLSIHGKDTPNKNNSQLRSCVISIKHLSTNEFRISATNARNQRHTDLQILLYSDFMYEHITYSQILSTFSSSVITSFSHHRRAYNGLVTHYVHRQHGLSGRWGWGWYKLPSPGAVGGPSGLLLAGHARAHSRTHTHTHTHAYI
jgi:hypothetical protein